MKEDKPKLKIVGEDGNAFAILGKATRVMRQEGWSKEKQDEVMKEATSGDYDNLLVTMMNHFDVE